jgi:hypothetical protein
MRRHRRRPQAGAKVPRPFSMKDKDRMEMDGRGNGGEEKGATSSHDGWRNCRRIQRFND